MSTSYGVSLRTFRTFWEIMFREPHTNQHLVTWSFLVSYVEERPWRAIQSPKKGRKKKAKGQEERDQVKFFYLRLETWQVVRFRKEYYRITILSTLSNSNSLEDRKNARNTDIIIKEDIRLEIFNGPEHFFRISRSSNYTNRNYAELTVGLKVTLVSCHSLLVEDTSLVERFCTSREKPRSEQKCPLQMTPEVQQEKDIINLNAELR